jgi:hypothetical protein
MALPPDCCARAMRLAAERVDILHELMGGMSPNVSRGMRRLPRQFSRQQGA